MTANVGGADGQMRVTNDGTGSKAVLCGRGQFESPALSKNDESGPEQVSGAIVAAPPVENPAVVHHCGVFL